jgi:hypothetical protein
MRAARFAAFAQSQYLEAHRWYEALQAGLGEQFSDQVNEAIKRMESNPGQFKIAAKQYRRALLKRFPYEMFFEFDDDHIIVYSVFHTSQNPRRWEAQLP